MPVTARRWPRPPAGPKAHDGRPTKVPVREKQQPPPARFKFVRGASAVTVHIGPATHAGVISVPVPRPPPRRPDADRPREQAGMHAAIKEEESHIRLPGPAAAERRCRVVDRELCVKQ